MTGRYDAGREPRPKHLLPPPHSFALNFTQQLPAAYRNPSVRLSSLFDNSLQSAVLTTYIGEIDWVLRQAPILRRVPVLYLNGRNEHHDILPKHFKVRTMLEDVQYGTFHSKIMLLKYPTGLRVVVTSANLVHSDWESKTQAIWCQDFPLIDNRNNFLNNRVSYKDKQIDEFCVEKDSEDENKDVLIFERKEEEQFLIGQIVIRIIRSDF
ncbi:MAG: putative Tyrosyl-DNA phosphodiesterase 1 [Streblomastix strix]|uniref:Putative Tyrosyl-DNA phosphodiesterase 1 n=1 Tax=Streblomastix strix TaxID=222440 RepID=A0A5J4TRY7_9EUKA|nr:MAG: putative Tyrosyl-DNA phosphodiesterase 1 [Streblomastix strix]